MKRLRRLPHFLCGLVAAATMLAPGNLCAQAPQGIVEIEVQAESLDWNTVAGSTDMYATWMVGETTYYAISKDGGATCATVRKADYTVHLRYSNFDPMRSEPVAPVAYLAANKETKLYIVQFVTQSIDAYRRHLSNQGVEIVHFMPNYGHIVRMNAQQAEQLRDINFVRWVGHYHPGYRLEARDRNALAKASAVTRKYNIQVAKKGLEDKLSLRKFIISIGGAPNEYTSPHGALITASLNASQLVAVVNRNEVLFADRWSEIENDMDNVRILMGSNYLEGVAGYTGEGVRGQIRDSGLLFTHGDWKFPPIPHNGTAGSQSHGTSVYGIVFGTGAGDPTKRGLLPDGQGVFHSSGTTVDRYIETMELIQPPYNCVFETNSTGNARTFFYTTISADMDTTLFDTDFVVLQSQSNAGNQDSRPQAWAKNMISVGAVRHYDTLTTADDAWAGGGSIGPADDGRLKPDICAFYDATGTTSSTGGYTESFGGTSGATPINAGHMGLIHQMWADGIFGNSLVSWDVFENRPHMTLAKALLINSAAQYTFSGAGHDLTRVHQGWGRPDVKNLFDNRDRMIFVNETDILPEFGSTVYVLNVTAADPEFQATMIYADPAGVPGSTKHRINDVTLKVTDPNGVIYWGNNGLEANNFSVAGGSANDLDTVENVIVNNPTPGTWLVEVTAAEINQDGHVETAAMDIDYALVVQGVDPALTPAPDNGQANQSDASMSIVDSLNINGQKPHVDINGPFYSDLPGGSALTFNWSGPINREFLLLYGNLNVGNAPYAGVGQLDIGTNGPALPLGIQVLLDGVNPTTFFDMLATAGPTGEQSLTFTVPAYGPQVLGTFQTAFWDISNSIVKLTAATQVSIH